MASTQPITVLQTETFDGWLTGLKDRSAASRIAKRLIRVQSGLLGDAKPVGGGVYELRIDDGPGYRLYFVQRGAVLIVLLCGGNKGSQQRDIAKAQTMAAGLEI